MTLVATFGFLPPNFRRWQAPTSSILFTIHKSKEQSAGTVFRGPYPIHGFREFLHSTGIVPVKAGVAFL